MHSALPRPGSDVPGRKWRLHFRRVVKFILRLVDLRHHAFAVRWFVPALLALVQILCVGCREREQLSKSPQRHPQAATASVAAQPEARLPPPQIVEVVGVDVPSGLPAFVLRGARGTDKMVFLHGLCGHAQGYAQSFQYSAARFGVLVAPQGDLACNGPWRSWSGDLRVIEARIAEAFAAAAIADSDGALLIGYSLGATRAEDLARKHPRRYARLVLIGAPRAPSSRGLSGLRGAVMMAGSRDRQSHMQAAARAFRTAGIPTTYRVLPGAAHGEMGPEAERVMGEVFDWLQKNAK
jgi:pimeloyl-ACP methyl ester carboxylesterase